MEKVAFSLLSIIVFGFIISLSAILYYDYSRFEKVYNAQTEQEIKETCKNYEMTSVKDVPQKCFNYFNKTN